ncbi:PREDICTED: probable GMP synthase [glutamine-hydrolyzing] [Theobroma cacao]|uniref:Probable GMP synthase [glutamine-hydrolyzing] n=1 Tax=Theobroma cacao TaxID=3641 RepID=A0AB32UUC3_THECC|nr:PREDICTED: probable GMP synthase [glutamine-hydrolyzing] [Theobroma cacao]
MSVATKLKSSPTPVTEPRAILGPTGNRVRVSDESKRKPEAQKKPQRPKFRVSKSPQSVVQSNVSVDSSCSSDSSSSNSSVKTVSSKKTVKRIGVKPVKAKVAPTADEVVAEPSPVLPEPLKRCDWITPFSDPLYTSLHDKEWGVPVHDDRKLFELLVFSQALAELSWPTILNKRDIFRKLFDNFDPSTIAQFTEKKLLSLKVNGSLLLSEPKLRAVVENAKQMLKVQQEFGSFSSYCWGFVNHKPIRNGFRYVRQVPVKTPKAELISKDMMQRGFRCVGPTVVYSFMQVAGIVNDHLVTCFRYQECNANVKKDIKPEIERLTKDVENTRLSC